MTAPTHRRRGPLALAVALLAVAAIAGWQLLQMPEPPAHAAVGPRAMPGALVVVLAALAIAYLMGALRGRQVDLLDDPAGSPLPGAPRRVALLSIGLAAILMLTPAAGIGVACTLAFVMVARAFGSRRVLRDLVAGLVFVFAIWFVFDRLLGVQLGRFAAFVPWP